VTRSRRELLAAAGTALGTAVVGATAGCLDTAAGDGPQGPEGTPATLSCADESFDRLTPPIDQPVASQTTETSATSLELSAEGTAETYGQSIRLVLRNTGDQSAATRGEHAYAIQRETTAGWLEVRGTTDGTDATLPTTESPLAAGDAYSWTIELTEAAMEASVPNRELAVCPPLGAGTHRFVYWGLADGPPIGIEFKLVG